MAKVRIVSRRQLREFGAGHPNALEPLKHWARVVEASVWTNPGELKAAFASADFVGELTVFNIGGNKFRLIAYVHYRHRIVYIKQVLTHAEYDEGKWK